jgi:hypothetical protein
VEGRNFVVERRFAAFKYDRVPDLTAELVRLKPDVLVTAGNPGIAALRQVTARTWMAGSSRTQRSRLTWANLTISGLESAR